MAIVAEGINKSYGRSQVLSDVSFECPTGMITGLLGPNGSGKSSTMRILAGLSRPTSGRALIDGVTFAELGNPGRRVGMLLDASAHHPGRSVEETTTIAALYMGVDRERVERVTDLMGLGTVRKRRFGALSLGMKQRVGLGIALLGQPTHLVLDEPVNGLDIEGISWLRELLVWFTREEGGSVLISSHLLQEMQTYADRVVIINRGRVVLERNLNETYDSGESIVKADDLALLGTALASRNIAHTFDGSRGVLVASASARTVATIARDASVLVLGLESGSTHSLEDLYLQVTDGEFTIKNSEELFRG